MRARARCTIRLVDGHIWPMTLGNLQGDVFHGAWSVTMREKRKKCNRTFRKGAWRDAPASSSIAAAAFAHHQLLGRIETATVFPCTVHPISVPSTPYRADHRTTVANHSDPGRL